LPVTQRFGTLRARAHSNVNIACYDLVSKPTAAGTFGRVRHLSSSHHDAGKESWRSKKACPRRPASLTTVAT